MTAHRTVATQATTAHRAMLQHDEACKANAALRNAALSDLFFGYGLSVTAIADMTGIKDRTIRAALFKSERGITK